MDNARMLCRVWATINPDGNQADWQDYCREQARIIMADPSIDNETAEAKIKTLKRAFDLSPKVQF